MSSRSARKSFRPSGRCMPTDPLPSNLHTDPLIHHGRHFGRAIYAFANIQALLLAGLGADEDSPPETQQERRELRVFKKLLTTIPDLEGRLMSSSGEEVMAITSMLQKGAASARSDDTKSLKGVILDWIGPLNPPLSRNVKHDRGFQHPQTGFLLCPPELDWSNSNIRKQLRNKEITISGSHWPIFVYKNETYDPENPWKGLFRNELLIKASSPGYKHIFTSPSSVKEQPKVTCSGNAQIHGMTHVTPASLAYTFTQIRFSLSSAGTFYTSVLELLEDPEEQDEVRPLVLWWNQRVFPSFSNARRLAPTSSALSRIKARRGRVGTAAASHPNE
ncbi:hypothetical protein FA13DRAFT_1756867 [Coprinellus micaceus]|uniref:Uncharacterized protein n=1 Tax=Coprinellus micaceus TaxID=71717 RepID=A0A4Y7SQW1_COPMI|nr:hypothetical protein FA13DRAFT_1756867 [Coprinellus micaceus]